MSGASAEALLRQALDAVRLAGTLALTPVTAADIGTKGTTDFVTAVDIRVQSFLQERLLALDPRSQLLGEEQAWKVPDLDRPTWVLDPIDGTTNLIHGYGHSAVSLAYVTGGRTAFGIVYNPFTGELYTAAAGKGAWRCGWPIRVSPAATLSESLCSAGTNPGCRREADNAFGRMRALYDRCHDIRRLGAASLELCQVACGRLECYLENGLKPWDFAAGRLIVEEAGGTVTDLRGQPLSLTQYSSDVLATNGRIHREALAAL